MVAGSSKYFNTPIVDADFMGRAYPTGHQGMLVLYRAIITACLQHCVHIVTPNVFDETKSGKNLLPIAMCSGDGNVLVSYQLSIPRNWKLKPYNFSS
jgi:DUF917 family protein